MKLYASSLVWALATIIWLEKTTTTDAGNIRRRGQSQQEAQQRDLQYAYLVNPDYDPNKPEVRDVTLEGRAEMDPNHPKNPLGRTYREPNSTKPPKKEQKEGRTKADEPPPKTGPKKAGGPPHKTAPPKNHKKPPKEGDGKPGGPKKGDRRDLQYAYLVNPHYDPNKPRTVDVVGVTLEGRAELGNDEDTDNPLGDHYKSTKAPKTTKTGESDNEGRRKLSYSYLYNSQYKPGPVSRFDFAEERAPVVGDLFMPSKGGGGGGNRNGSNNNRGKKKKGGGGKHGGKKKNGGGKGSKGGGSGGGGSSPIDNKIVTGQCSDICGQSGGPPPQCSANSVLQWQDQSANSCCCSEGVSYLKMQLSDINYFRSNDLIGTFTIDTSSSTTPSPSTSQVQTPLPTAVPTVAPSATTTFVPSLVRGVSDTSDSNASSKKQNTGDKKVGNGGKKSVNGKKGRKKGNGRYLQDSEDPYNICIVDCNDDCLLNPLSGTPCSTLTESVLMTNGASVCFVRTDEEGNPLFDQRLPTTITFSFNVSETEKYYNEIDTSCGNPLVYPWASMALPIEKAVAIPNPINSMVPQQIDMPIFIYQGGVSVGSYTAAMSDRSNEAGFLLDPGSCGCGCDTQSPTSFPTTLISCDPTGTSENIDEPDTGGDVVDVIPNTDPDRNIPEVTGGPNLVNIGDPEDPDTTGPEGTPISITDPNSIPITSDPDGEEPFYPLEPDEPRTMAPQAPTGANSREPTPTPTPSIGDDDDVDIVRDAPLEAPTEPPTCEHAPSSAPTDMDDIADAPNDTSGTDGDLNAGPETNVSVSDPDTPSNVSSPDQVVDVDPDTPSSTPTDTDDRADAPNDTSGADGDLNAGPGTNPDTPSDVSSPDRVVSMDPDTDIGVGENIDPDPVDPTDPGTPVAVTDPVDPVVDPVLVVDPIPLPEDVPDLETNTGDDEGIDSPIAVFPPDDRGVVTTIDTNTDIDRNSDSDTDINTTVPAPISVPVRIPIPVPIQLATTSSPTGLPTRTPSSVPSTTPSSVPIPSPTFSPTNSPTNSPTSSPTSLPVDAPGDVPSSYPTCSGHPELLAREINTCGIGNSKSIYDYLCSVNNFSNFCAMIQRAGLRDMFAGIDGVTEFITVFAPTNSGCNSGGLTIDEINSMDANLLKHIVMTHATEGKVRAENLQCEGELPTLKGTFSVHTTKCFRSMHARAQYGFFNVDEGKYPMILSPNNLELCNGYIQPVNNMIRVINF